MRKRINRLMYDLGFPVVTMDGVDYPRTPRRKRSEIVNGIARTITDHVQSERWRVFIRNNFINMRAA